MNLLVASRVWQNEASKAKEMKRAEVESETEDSLQIGQRWT